MPSRPWPRTPRQRSNLPTRFVWEHGTGAPKGPFRVIDTVGLNTAYNIVMQYQGVPGLLNPLFKKMMLPYNYKAIAKLLKGMIDRGESFY